MAIQIRCADCGAPRWTTRRNTKYCGVCRLYKNVRFIREYRKKCWDCEAAFAPLTRNDTLCGTCDDTIKDVGRTEKCLMCKRPGRLYLPDVQICLACIKNPSKRPDLQRRLKRGVEARKDTDYEPLPPETDPDYVDQSEEPTI